MPREPASRWSTLLTANATLNMSSEQQSLDPHLVEETRQQIRSLVAEIAQLSRSEITPEQFYEEFLNRVVSALAAVGGAVWTVSDEGGLALSYQINLPQAQLAGPEESRQRHGRLLYRALREGEALLVPPRSGAEGDEEAGNPTEFLVLLGVLKTDVQTAGVVEVFQRTGAGPAAQRGYLRFLVQMCDLAGDFLRSYQLKHFSDRQALWNQLEEYSRAVHLNLDPRQTAYTIANEGRRLVRCDRLSVALRKGRRCVIEAVSGQDLVDKRSNVVRLLGRLATAVVNGGETVWYSGDTSDMAPQIEEAVQDYVDEAHSKLIGILPLRRPQAKDAEEEAGGAGEPAPLLGALIVEQIEDTRPAPGMTDRLEVVARHSAAALGNAMEHQDLFLMPLWRALGKAKWVVQARTLPKTLTIAAAVLVLLLVLALWPVTFRLQGKGTLEPVIRQNIFARVDGVVTDVKAKHGDLVQRGQLLVTLRNTDLQVQLEEVQGQLEATQERMAMLQRLRLDPDLWKTLAEGEKIRVAGELEELEQQRLSLEKQRGLFEKKMDDLQVRSSLSGLVVTWDLKNRLLYRPVGRGQVLMRVADPSGPWQLEVHMPERYIGYITDARARLGDDLEVQYQLATNPGSRYYGRVKEVHLAAEVEGEEGNVVLIKVSVPDQTREQLRPYLRPGAEVTAKVDCGRRSLGFVLFHDLIAFVQSRILFRFF